MNDLNTSWGPIRSALSCFTFAEIKDTVGNAGLDILDLAAFQQGGMSGPSKGQLLTAIDRLIRDFDIERRELFLRIVAEEILSCPSDKIKEKLAKDLSRLGWQILEGKIIPRGLIDVRDMVSLPTEAHKEIAKAADRFRDGDLAGAISAACGAVDTVTSAMYESLKLGDPGKVGFQEKVVTCLKARGYFAQLESELLAVKWTEPDIKLFSKNVNGSINQAAYVMQTLRSHMGDVHGTKPVLIPLAFDTIKWAALILSLLKA